ncbi:Vitamin B12 import ATP-binding protein BtuD [subsurface metagenome]
MIIFVLFNRMKVHVTKISASAIRIREQIPNIYRYFDLLNLLAPQVAGVDEEVTGHVFHKIEARSVDFKYDQEFILNDVNFEACAGDRILIQGPSGQGKSTFLEILCGILPPSNGVVLYDGNCLDEEFFYKVRPLIAYVSPTVYLFQDTLRENLVMGMPIEEKKLDRALKLSRLDEMVAELPDGLDSFIGIDGDNLSLGQRQRVILARLYLKNPRLVLLDEATANLDLELENQIIENLLSFLDPQSILVMVAHKEPKGMPFNKRFIMENGSLMPAAFSSSA